MRKVFYLNKISKTTTNELYHKGAYKHFFKLKLNNNAYFIFILLQFSFFKDFNIHKL